MISAAMGVLLALCEEANSGAMLILGDCSQFGVMFWLLAMVASMKWCWRSERDNNNRLGFIVIRRIWHNAEQKRRNAASLSPLPALVRLIYRDFEFLGRVDIQDDAITSIAGNFVVMHDGERGFCESGFVLFEILDTVSTVGDFSGFAFEFGNLRDDVSVAFNLQLLWKLLW